jgi:ribosomal subunit interface protein
MNERPCKGGKSMKINISGKNLNLGESLREYALDKIGEATDKYFAGPVSGKVVIEKLRGDFITACSLHLHSGLNVQTSAHAHDAYVSVDESVEKLDKQLRRYKRRLKNHHHSEQASLPGVVAVDYTIGSAGEDADEAAEGSAPVIAEEETTVPSLSVSDAVMRMDLSGELFLIFRNAKHDRINIVYRRADGNIGWIDPVGVIAKKSQ